MPEEGKKPENEKKNDNGLNGNETPEERIAFNFGYGRQYSQEKNAAVREKLSFPKQPLSTPPRQIVQPSKELILPPRLKNWGIRKKDLEAFSYSGLQDALRGTHNISIPYQILDLEYPDEILANYMGIARLKKQRTTLTALFLQITEEIQRAALGRSINVLRNRLIEEQGERTPLLTRLERVEVSARDAFVSSCLSPYVYSESEDSELGKYVDPEIRGGGKRAYIDGIMSSISEKFDKSPAR